jgi:glycosyltransferase involved in cell wall biosynthesis
MGQKDNAEMKYVDISIIITAHAEGLLVHRTLRSVARSIVVAESQGVSCEVIVVLDSPDSRTLEYFSQQHAEWPGEMKICQVDFRDPGLARNYGAIVASGKYIAFIDADDLFGDKWLSRAYDVVQRDESAVVCYPEYVVVFDHQNLIAKYIGTDDPLFNYQNLIEYNRWNSVHFLIEKQYFLLNQFTPTPQSSGLGYEDWHWYCEALARGYTIKIVPETCVFYRRKASGSRLLEHNNEMTVLPKTKLFRPDIFNKLIGAEAVKKNGANTVDLQRVKPNLRKYIEKYSDAVFNAYPKLYPWLVSKGILAGNGSDVARIPSWLLEEWKTINQIEPKIYPDAGTTQPENFYCPPTSRIAWPYLQLANLYGEGVSHLFFVPWLKRGGSDLVTINYIKALAESGKTGRIVVISDIASDSPWAARLPVGVTFIELGKMFGSLNDDEKEKLLVRLLVQYEPKVIHNINSDLFYRMLIKYGKVLHSISRIYVSTFCAEFTSEGKMDGYPFRYLPECFDYIEKIIFDNVHFKEHLRELYGFEQDKLSLVYTPLEIEAKTDRPANQREKTIDILWAGRLDKQKRPDLLIEIIKRCQGDSFTFHVYGGSLLSTDCYTEVLKKFENVRLYGEFDGISSLPLDSFDLLLFTSQYEGLPTTLIEVMLHKLPVMASAVGGIPEVIKHKVTGILVDPYDDVSQYVTFLNDIVNEQYDVRSLAEAGHALVSSQHSWEAFSKQLSTIAGYIPEVASD